MSRRDLAETTGLSYPYISQIETGYRMPSTPAMRSLADALGLRPDALFEAIPPAAGRDAAPARPAEPAPAAPGSPMPPADAAIPPAAPQAAPATPRFAAPPAAAPAAAAPHGGSAVPAVAAAGNPARPTTAASASGRPPAIGAAPAPAPAAAGSTAPPVGSPAAGASADVAAGAAGGWIPNRSFRPVAALATAAPDAGGHRDHAVDRAAALLTALPADERLPALTEVQARVVRSVIDDEIRRDGVR